MDSIVTVIEDSVFIVEAAGQGPAGPSGPTGSSGSPYMAFMADGPLSGQRVVRPTTAGKVGYADSSTPAHANIVIGITTGAVSDASPVSVQAFGVMTEPTWAWIPDLPVFCGVNGALTQTPPISGFSLVVGIATSPTDLVVGIKQPINVS